MGNYFKNLMLSISAVCELVFSFISWFHITHVTDQKTQLSLIKLLE